MNLKRCPFCGSKADTYIDNQWQDRFVVECEGCGCQRRHEYSMRDAIEDWNTRYVEQEAEANG